MASSASQSRSSLTTAPSNSESSDSEAVNSDRKSESETSQEKSEDNSQDIQQAETCISRRTENRKQRLSESSFNGCRKCNGLVAVPITYFSWHCKKQFDIVGLLQSSSDEQAGTPNLRRYDDFKEMRQDMSFTGASGKKANGNPVLSGKSEKGNFLFNETTGEYVHSVFARIVLRRNQTKEQ